MSSFNIPLLAAKLAVFIAVIFNYSSLKKGIVTGCFRADNLKIQVRDLANPSSPTSAEVFQAVYDNTLCEDVDYQAFTFHKEYIRSAQNPVQFFGCDQTSERFCCLVIEPLSDPNSPEYSDVPDINFGDGLKKYRVTAVRCKP